MTDVQKNARELYNQIDAYLDAKEKLSCCVFDIDGVLSNYPEFWVDYANKELNANFETIEELRKGVSREKYLITKEKYRVSGIRKQMLLKSNVRKVFKVLKNKGYSINILTCRKKTDLVEEDTLEWLHKNKLKFDEINWSSDKVSAMKYSFPKAKFVVEDELRNALPLANAGFKVYFLGKEEIEHLNIIKINDLIEILVKEVLM